VNPWHVWWLLFTLTGLSVETVALLRTQTGDTASEWVWAYLKVTPGKTTVSAALARFATYPVLAAGVWLTVHFAFGLFA
jgi:hypothetical protein